MPAKTKAPYVWVTWISKLIAGDAQCWWSAWFRANRWYNKLPRDFDLSAWTVNHNEMVTIQADELRSEGWTVTLEDQNKFKAAGSLGILSGCPDIVAVKDGRGLVVDCKTGDQRTSDAVQVLIYMTILPKLPQWKGIVFDGLVVYRAGGTAIHADKADDEFKTRLKSAMSTACHGEEPKAVPSFHECRFCDIGLSYCKVRVEKEEPAADASEVF